MHRALDVLDLVIAAVDEIDADATMHIFVDAVRNCHAAGIGERLETGSHVDPIAVEIAVLDHDVAEVNTDAENDGPVFRHVSVRGRHGLLKGCGAFDGVDGAAELDEHTVAGPFEDAALM